MSGKPLLKIGVPGIPLLAAALWVTVAPGSPLLAEMAGGYPDVVLGVAVLLAWRFRGSRVIAAAVALILVLLLPMVATDAATVGLAAGLAALVLAPTFAVLALLADRRLGAPRALLQLSAAPALALLGWGVLDMHRAPVERLLGSTFVDPAWTAWTGLPQVALAGAAAGSAALVGVVLLRGRTLDAALLWAALAGTLALASTEPTPQGLWILAGGLALCLGVIEASYALAFRDELTDLPGRRSLNELLGSLRPPTAVAIVDIDKFKNFNDRHGHDVGDQVLRMVAARLGSVSGRGRAFRSGGEEFTIVFPGSTKEEALPHLEALRKEIADAEFRVRGITRPAGAKGAGRRKDGGNAKAKGKGSRGARGAGSDSRGRLRVTVSIGVAAFGDRNATVDDTVRSADKAMYRAKQDGRNRVVA